MAGSSAESLTLKDAFTNWLSITALRHIPPDQKSVFRKLEKLELKIIRLEGHLEFNQACIRNKLLPTYTKIRTMSLGVSGGEPTLVGRELIKKA